MNGCPVIQNRVGSWLTVCSLINHKIWASCKRLSAVSYINTLNLHKIYLLVALDNEKAIHLYKKCGFIEEGHLVEEYFMNGRYRDVKRAAGGEGGGGEHGSGGRSRGKRK